VHNATQSDFCGACAVQSMIERGAPKSKLHLGVPFYGRGWTGVTNANHGLYQKATGAAAGASEAGIQNYNLLYNAAGATTYSDSLTRATWSFDGTNFWSFDTPDAIAYKAAWAKSLGLGGLFAWSADGDVGATLTAMMVAP